MSSGSGDEEAKQKRQRVDDGSALPAPDLDANRREPTASSSEGAAETAAAPAPASEAPPPAEEEPAAEGLAPPAEEAAPAEPPPSQDSLSYVNMWYYDDAAGVQQGPFSSFEMRSWFVAGYMAPTTLVAPSWYGEVPATTWSISTLWSNPAMVFVLADEAAAGAAVVEQAGPEFIPSDTFCGGKPGYAFKTDFYGTGYYRDDPQPIEITCAARHQLR